LIDAYIHFNGRVGVLVRSTARRTSWRRTPEFKEFARNVALHVASMRPIVVAPEDIPAETREEERQVVDKQVAEMGKPENIRPRSSRAGCASGSPSRPCLPSPTSRRRTRRSGTFCRTPIQRVGENVVIRRFVRYEL
jgi:elongation factor Ts